MRLPNSKSLSKRESGTKLCSRIRVPQLVRNEPLLLLLIILATVIYALYSILRHKHFQSNGYDLGIFDQAVRSYSELRLPSSTVREMPNLLSDHFSPILLLLAPLYWIWDDPRMLLIAQALLVSSSLIPIFLFAKPRIGRAAAYLFALAYTLFWGIHAAVAFDFHEVAFAPLLIATAIYAIDLKRIRMYIVSITLLLLVKEDMSILIAFFGLYLLLLRQLRLGTLTLLAGIIWYPLVTSLIMPSFTEGQAFQYWSFNTFGSDPLDAIYNIVRDPGLVPHTLISNPQKIKTLLYTFIPFLCLTLYSPLILLSIPLLAARMLSDNPLFWGTQFHYSLTLAPILVMGAADGLRNVLNALDVVNGRKLAAISCGALMVIGGYMLALRFPLSSLRSEGIYQSSEVERSAADAVAVVPEDVSITAQDFLIPHLTSKGRYVYELNTRAPKTDYIVVNSGGTMGSPWPNATFLEMQILVDKRRPLYKTVFKANGFEVLKLR